MWRKGCTARTIAAALNRSADVVFYQAWKMKLRRYFRWTDDRLQQVEEMWARGMSMREIAVALGASVKGVEHARARLKKMARQPVARHTAPRPAPIKKKPAPKPAFEPGINPARWRFIHPAPPPCDRQGYRMWLASGELAERCLRHGGWLPARKKSLMIGETNVHA